MQEFEAAKAAILQVHPDANVVGNRIDEYPITVTVSKGELVMWERPAARAVQPERQARAGGHHRRPRGGAGTVSEVRSP